MIRKTLLFLALGIVTLFSCSDSEKTKSNKEATNNMEQTNILLLHHSTGGLIYTGHQKGMKAFKQKKINKKTSVEIWFDEYNSNNGTNYSIGRTHFPKKEPYGWNNYPYDYYNIWVKNAGDKPYMEEPTLEMLTKENDVLIWKHCYPVGNIKEDTGNPNVDSSEKRIENYKLQYDTLKSKMHEFPDTKFIVWTGAALTESWTTEENAKRAKKFFEWVRNEWDEDGDNIYLWDLYSLETEDGIYLKKEYATGGTNPHPNNNFTSNNYQYLCQRIVDVIENNGAKTDLTGKKL